MTLEPLNRHVWLKPVLKKKTEEKQSTILVPEDYSVKKRYETYELVAVSSDCIHLSNDDVGRTLLVDNAMVEQVDINDNVFYLLLENYIYGALKPQ
jgi:hypothetical protein